MWATSTFTFVRPSHQCHEKYSPAGCQNKNPRPSSSDQSPRAPGGSFIATAPTVEEFRRRTSTSWRKRAPRAKSSNFLNAELFWCDRTRVPHRFVEVGPENAAGIRNVWRTVGRPLATRVKTQL